MKKLIFLIIFAFFVMDLYLVSAENQNYEPNQLIVKFKEVNIPKKIALTPKGYIVTGIPSIDKLNSKYIINSIKKVIEKSSSHGLKHGLHRIYVLKTKKKIDVESVVEEFKNDPNVEYAEPSYILSLDSTAPNDPYFAAQELWGLHNIGLNGLYDADIDAPEAWDVTTGSNNVVVALIDSGVDYTHPDLADNMWTNPGEIPDNGGDDDGNGFIDDYYGYDFSTCARWLYSFGWICTKEKDPDPDPMDDKGHGTNCAGIIGSVGNNNIGIVGVNWNVKIMGIKVTSQIPERPTGYYRVSDIVAGINYATLMEVPIISMSGGSSDNPQVLYNAIEAARDAGILFVTTAGNDATNTDIDPHYPSSYDLDNIISVAATDRYDNLASFSNFGPTSVDLGAPGKGIFSTTLNGEYEYGSGTSMAAPHVAGVAALVKSKYPYLGYMGIKNAILNSVDPLSSLEGKVLSEGRLNAFKTLCNPDGTGSDRLCHEACGADSGCDAKIPGQSWCEGDIKKSCSSICQYSEINCKEEYGSSYTCIPSFHDYCGYDWGGGGADGWRRPRMLGLTEVDIIIIIVTVVLIVIVVSVFKFFAKKK